MLRFAKSVKHFTGSLAPGRDQPLEITNNIRVKIAYQISDVTRPQTHRVVCLWLKTSFVNNLSNARISMLCFIRACYLK